MQAFSSIKDGLAAMKTMTDTHRKKVGALLTFQDTKRKQVDLCFLFQSIEGPDSQLINLYPTDLKIVGEDRADMPHLVSARNTAISSLLNVFDHEDFGIVEHGHAEEFLIREFDAARGEVAKQQHVIENVTIYLSHSPCTVHDAQPSNTLHGWPESCTAKLRALAAAHPGLFFSICYWKQFGALEGSTTAESSLKALSGNLRNLAFAKV